MCSGLVYPGHFVWVWNKALKTNPLEFEVLREEIKVAFRKPQTLDIVHFFALFLEDFINSPHSGTLTLFGSGLCARAL